MPDADYTLERNLLEHGRRRIAFFDEVGRGALAGPLVVVAVTITAATDPDHPPLRDSKQVPRHRHAGLAAAADAWVEQSATAWVSAHDIDRHGISGALRRAAIDCHRQLCAAGTPPDLCYFDGPRPFATSSQLDGCDVDARPHLDATSAACAAASLIAKTARDTRMVELAGAHPAYGFDRHVGYGTAAHQAAIAEHGLTDEHRATFCTRITSPQLALEL